MSITEGSTLTTKSTNGSGKPPSGCSEYGVIDMKLQLAHMEKATGDDRSEIMAYAAFQIFRQIFIGELEVGYAEEQFRSVANKIGAAKDLTDVAWAYGRKMGRANPAGVTPLRTLAPSQGPTDKLIQDLLDAELAPKTDRIIDATSAVKTDRTIEKERDREEVLEPDLDLKSFLNQVEPEKEYDWLVPGLLERKDRWMLTGAEGHGKSTLLRQIAVQVSAGIHPFTLDPIPPVRVLLIDLENSANHVRRQLTPLALVAGEPSPEYFRIRIQPQGMDLTSIFEQDRLETRIRANKPELLVIGPFYKMFDGDPIDEAGAKELKGFLDHIRETYNLALLIEAHSAKAYGGAKRTLEPYGASLWLRWPEFGNGIAPNDDLVDWRGVRETGRDFPKKLARGGEWPWMAVGKGPDMTFARVIDECRKAGKVLGHRELGDLLGCDHRTVGRAIKANQRQWDREKSQFASGA